MSGERLDGVGEEGARERVELLLASEAVRDEAALAREGVREPEEAHLLLGRALSERDLEDLLRERERVVLVIRHQDLRDVKQRLLVDNQRAGSEVPSRAQGGSERRVRVDLARRRGKTESGHGDGCS